MKAAELFVRCLENEGVEYVFGIPGEENIDIMDVLLDSPIQFVPTRHEQGAAFMADVYGRLTGRAGVCLATLGPGATNLVTGVADANMDRAPRGGHLRPGGDDADAQGEPSDAQPRQSLHADLEVPHASGPPGDDSRGRPQGVQTGGAGEARRQLYRLSRGRCGDGGFRQAAVEGAAANVAGGAGKEDPPGGGHHFQREVSGHHGRQRGDPRRAAGQLLRMAGKLHIPVASTFMAKGVVPFSHCLWLGAVGMRAHDYVACGFDRADVIICVGYDMVEYPPSLWHPTKDRQIVHIDSAPAEVDENYIVACGLVGDIGAALDGIAELARPQEHYPAAGLWRAIMNECCEYADDDSFPLKPQRIVWELQRTLAKNCNVVCDVGAHKVWMARMYQPERPNSCIISNGFAAMGIGVPGAVAAKLAFPDRPAVTVTGDAGFMMNSQELETAMRIGAPIVVVIWNDNGYGLIEWHQLRHFGRPAYVRFGNPDFVKYAESFGARGYRVESADELRPTVERAIADNAVAVIDCPVDYSENMKLTEKLSKMVCPV